MSWVAPTTDQFKAFFPARYFPYGSGTNAVTDADIQLAINTAQTGYSWNPALFDATNVAPAGQPVQSEQLTAFMNLAAHVMVLNIQAAGGLKAKGMPAAVLSGAEGIVESKSAGGLSLSQSYPSWVKDNPIYWEMTMTRFGRQYLNMVMPRCVGNMMIVGGEFLPRGWF